MEYWSDGMGEEGVGDTNQHLAYTPKALNSKAQCRVAHAGLPITPMTEPQRGSTKDAERAN